MRTKTISVARTTDRLLKLAAKRLTLEKQEAKLRDDLLVAMQAAGIQALRRPRGLVSVKRSVKTKFNTAAILELVPAAELQQLKAVKILKGGFDKLVLNRPELRHFVKYGAPTFSVLVNVKK